MKYRLDYGGSFPLQPYQSSDESEHFKLSSLPKQPKAQADSALGAKHDPNDGSGASCAKDSVGQEQKRYSRCHWDKNSD